MSLDEFLRLATQGILVLIAIITLVSYLRSREQTRLDITLMFGFLAYVVIVAHLRSIRSAEDTLDRLLMLSTQMALMAHPYLLLRLVLDFRPVPDRMRWFAFAGMIGSWALLLVFPSPLPSPIVLTLIAYFVFVELYSVTVFVRGAMTAAGVTRWRLVLVAAGSGLLALVLFNAGLSNLFPTAAPVITTINRVLALFSMLAYYGGFATPYWLRRYWQLSELQRFIRQTDGPWAGEPVVSTLERLCRVTTRAVGGIGAMVVLWHERDNQLVIRASTDTVVLPSGQRVNSEAVWRSWQTRAPIMGHIPADFTDEQTPITAAIGARATMIVPIMTRERAWGILQIFNRRNSLFSADDINLLSLFAEQTAIALGYATLVTEQQNLIHQLNQRTTQLEIAFNEMESFSYSVSHDLRSPLRHISGYIELLQKHLAVPLDETGHRYITIILEEARRMGTLIDDLLAFSRFSRTEMHQTEVDFDQLVHEVIATFEQEVQDRDIIWRIQPLFRVQGDRSMLRLVMSNLISNALKFSRRQAQVEIEIGAKRTPDEVVFYVCDNGIGFDMGYAGQLFGVFQRLHKATEFEGTGIGLANVRRIIQRHGGKTWAESTVGQGATFYFTFPRGRVVSEESVTVPPVRRRVGDEEGFNSD